MQVHKSITLKRVATAAEKAQRTLESPGFCTACGKKVNGVDLDARKEQCPHCGARAVYGAEQLAMELA